MKKENINRLYQLMLEDDEMLMGSQWEEMYCNEYDTPKSILNNFLDIYLATNFVEVDDDLKTTPLANQEEKIMAMIKYLEKIIKDLKNKIEIENNANNWGARMKRVKCKVTYETVMWMTDSEFEGTKEQVDTGEVEKEIKKILDFELLAEDGREESSEITEFYFGMDEQW